MHQLTCSTSRYAVAAVVSIHECAGRLLACLNVLIDFEELYYMLGWSSSPHVVDIDRHTRQNFMNENNYVNLRSTDLAIIIIGPAGACVAIGSKQQHTQKNKLFYEARVSDPNQLINSCQ